MTLTNKQLYAAYIPRQDQLLVDRLRTYLNDTAELNTLSGAEESSDSLLYLCLIDTVEEINNEFEPETSWTLQTVPSWNALKLGATLQLLISKGILSARNTLTYTDAGGVTVQDLDTYGRYINFYNILLNRYMRAVQAMKLRANIDACYGGVASEYSELGE